jgi:putative ABC transport system permease protein
MNDLKFAFRQLVQNPGFTAVAVLSLSLGLGVNTAMFSVVDCILLKPLPYREPERLVNVFENCKAQKLDFVDLNAPGFQDWRAQNTVFEDMAAYRVRGFDLTGFALPERLLGVRASASLFSLLGVNAGLGRLFDASEDVFGKERVAVLSYGAWWERFGHQTNILGKTITLDGNSYSIIGVLPTEFHFQNIAAEVWVPLALEPWELESRGAHDYLGIARLKPGVTLDQARSVMGAITTRLSNQFELAKGWGLTLVPMQEQIVGGSRKALVMLMGAVGLVLLIVCSNVANLLMVRAVAREREFAMRVALGAGHGRLVRQLLCESLLLAAAGGLLGALVAFWTLGTVVKFGASTFPRLDEVGLDWRALAFGVTLTLATVLVFGLVPAWLSFNHKLSDVLNNGNRGSTQGRRQIFRVGFVTCQVGLSLILLIGAALLLRSFARLSSVDLGFQTDHILTAALSMPEARFPGREAQRKAFLAQVVERVSALPGVDSAASLMGLPLVFGGARSEVFVEGRAEPKLNEPRAAGYSQISPDYFRTMKIPLLRGRPFNSTDTTNAPYVAIVNEAFARTFFKGENPIGKRLRVMDSHRDEPTEIIGVVRDIRQRDIANPPREEMYFPLAQRCWFDAQLVVHTKTDAATMIPALRRAVAEIDSAQALYLVRSFDSVIHGVLAPRRLPMLLVASFASAALLLAALGLYGVMTFVVTQRTREIGLRLSLGAQKHQILGLVLRQGLGLVLVGIVLGLGGAFALTRLLRTLLFEVSPIDLLSFTLLPAVLVIIGSLACWLPARRATRVDPIQALRYE